MLTATNFNIKENRFSITCIKHANLLEGPTSSWPWQLELVVQAHTFGPRQGLQQILYALLLLLHLEQYVRAKFQLRLVSNEVLRISPPEITVQNHGRHTAVEKVMGHDSVPSSGVLPTVDDMHTRKITPVQANWRRGLALSSAVCCASRLADWSTFKCCTYYWGQLKLSTNKSGGHCSGSEPQQTANNN